MALIGNTSFDIGGVDLKPLAKGLKEANAKLSRFRSMARKVMRNAIQAEAKALKAGG